MEDASAALPISFGALSLNHQYTEASGLPFEIRVLLLLKLDSLDSLHALIRASPCFLRAFLASKTQILTAIVHHRNDAEILVDALAACDASTFDRDMPTKDRVDRIVEHYDKHRRNQNIRPAVSSLLLPRVCQLSRTIDWHVVNYLRLCRSTLDRPQFASFDSYGLPADIRDDLFLSAAERCRLKRAFYRFQLFTQLFTQHVNGSMFGLEHVGISFGVRRFTSLFWPWELEEFVSVRDYVRAHFLPYLQSLEDQFVDAFVTEVSSSVATPPPTVQSMESSSDYRDWNVFVFPEVQSERSTEYWDPRGGGPSKPTSDREAGFHCFLQELDMDGKYNFFGVQYKQSHLWFIDELGFRSLIELHRVFQHTDLQRILEIWHRRDCPGLREHMIHPLFQASFHGKCRQPPQGTNWDVFLSQIQSLPANHAQVPSAGWLWGYPGESLFSDHWYKWDNDGLSLHRETGYVFWDKCRLERSPLLTLW